MSVLNNNIMGSAEVKPKSSSSVSFIEKEVITIEVDLDKKIPIETIELLNCKLLGIFRVSR